uniref:F-box domain-containing protein n=1 Tax=Setaria viridis TaxID=4556 RepID=A0A4U6VMC6_SETVI|nr:hypothetical protein SEVIR_2G018400v2 [Setaria viridis]
MDLTGGEVPAKPSAAAGEDRLSALPNDILVLILLRLGTAAAAGRTSVLSHRWRRLWALLPVLRFPVASLPRLISSALAARDAALRHLRSVAAWLPVAARCLSGDLLYRNVALLPGGGEEDGAGERGAFELPCYENATLISFYLGFLGLAVPPAGVFARLTEHTAYMWAHNA